MIDGKDGEVPAGDAKDLEDPPGDGTHGGSAM
jgi:hypothetical protein